MHFLLLLYFQISQFKPIKIQHQKQQNQDLKVSFKKIYRESYSIIFQNPTISLPLKKRTGKKSIKLR